MAKSRRPETERYCAITLILLILVNVRKVSLLGSALLCIYDFWTKESEAINLQLLAHLAMPTWAYMIVICRWCRCCCCCCCCWCLCLWTVLSKSRFKEQIIVLTPDSLTSTGNGMWGTKLRPSRLSKRSAGVAPVVNLHNKNKVPLFFLFKLQ